MQIMNNLKEIINPGSLELITKVGNCAIHAMSSLLIEKDTNHQLLEVARLQEDKKKRVKGNFGGEAIVLTQEIIN